MMFLELMVIEIREDEDAAGMKPELNIQERKDGTKYNNDNKRNKDEMDKTCSIMNSYIHNEEQPDNKDDRLSMFTDDSSTITRNAGQTQQARRNM